MRRLATLVVLAGCGGTPGDGKPPGGTLLASDHDLVWIEADATHVYFTTTDHKIGRLPASGGSAEVLATASTAIASVALADDSLYLALEDHRLDRRGELAGTLRIASLAK